MGRDVILFFAVTQIYIILSANLLECLLSVIMDSLLLHGIRKVSNWGLSSLNNTRKLFLAHIYGIQLGNFEYSGYLYRLDYVL